MTEGDRVQMRFIINTHCRNKEDGTGGTCSTQWGEKKYAQNFGGEI